MRFGLFLYCFSFLLRGSLCFCVSQDLPSDFQGFFKAFEEKNLEQMREFLDSGYYDVNAKNEDGHTALFLAAVFGNLDGLDILLAHHAVINPEDQLLQCLVSYIDDEGNNLACLELLLKNGADPNSAGKRGDRYQETPLELAAYLNKTDFVRVLLMYGAKDEVSSSYDRQPALFSAVAHNNVEMVRLLLEKSSKPNPNIRILSSGLTALHYASFYGFIDCVKFLLDKGADPNAVGDTPSRSHEETCGYDYFVKNLMGTPEIFSIVTFDGFLYDSRHGSSYCDVRTTPPEWAAQMLDWTIKYSKRDSGGGVGGTQADYEAIVELFNVRRISHMGRVLLRQM